LLSLRGGSLYHRQAITLLSGPERIEARWWSGNEVCRDYYVAREGGGSRLWIYRERGGERHWYLHGYFA
ncbi:MAG: DNA polymerase Y family protein, partial [Gammaproteobacteria bacterium]|nr:DNA polymerase Y family protein [Gammaproteobacteria bacterium]